MIHIKLIFLLPKNAHHIFSIFLHIFCTIGVFVPKLIAFASDDHYFRVFQFRKVISSRESCFKLVPRDYPVEITKKEIGAESTLIEGQFKTPMELHMPGVVPEESQQAHFQLLIPNKWKNEKHKPICIHLAGTGDHVSTIERDPSSKFRD